VIKIYNSITQAAKVIGSVSRDPISYACQGKLDTCKGYKWRYVE